MKKTITLHFSECPEFQHPLVGGGTSSGPKTFEIEVDDTPKPFLILKKLNKTEVYFGSPSSEPCHFCAKGPVKYVKPLSDGWVGVYECEACRSVFHQLMAATGQDGTLTRVK